LSSKVFERPVLGTSAAEVHDLRGRIDKLEKEKQELDKQNHSAKAELERKEFEIEDLKRESARKSTAITSQKRMTEQAEKKAAADLNMMKSKVAMLEIKLRRREEKQKPDSGANGANKKEAIEVEDDIMEVAPNADGAGEEEDEFGDESDFMASLGSIEEQELACSTAEDDDQDDEKSEKMDGEAGEDGTGEDDPVPAQGGHVGSMAEPLPQLPSAPSAEDREDGPGAAPPARPGEDQEAGPGAALPPAEVEDAGVQINHSIVQQIDEQIEALKTPARTMSEYEETKLNTLIERRKQFESVETKNVNKRGPTKKTARSKSKSNDAAARKSTRKRSSTEKCDTEVMETKVAKVAEKPAEETKKAKYKIPSAHLEVLSKAPQTETSFFKAARPKSIAVIKNKKAILELQVGTDPHVALAAFLMEKKDAMAAEGEQVESEVDGYDSFEDGLVELRSSSSYGHMVWAYNKLHHFCLDVEEFR
jgi:hypothetical protein